jgi:hypothetical protein
MMNCLVAKNLLMQALCGDASAGYRGLPTPKEAWDQLLEDRKKGDLRKMFECVHTFTNTPFAKDVTCV